MIVGASVNPSGGEALRGGIPVAGALTQTTAARLIPIPPSEIPRRRAITWRTVDIFALVGVALLGAIGLGLFGVVLAILFRGGGGRHR